MSRPASFTILAVASPRASYTADLKEAKALLDELGCTSLTHSRRLLLVRLWLLADIQCERA